MNHDLARGMGFLIGHPSQFILLGVSLALSSITVVIVSPAFNFLRDRFARFLKAIAPLPANDEAMDVLQQWVFDPEIDKIERLLKSTFFLCVSSFLLLLIHISFCPFTNPDSWWFFILDGLTLVVFVVVLVHLAILFSYILKCARESF